MPDSTLKQLSETAAQAGYDGEEDIAMSSIQTIVDTINSKDVTPTDVGDIILGAVKGLTARLREDAEAALLP